jgi:hypothetical protein
MDNEESNLFKYKANAVQNVLPGWGENTGRKREPAERGGVE